MSFNERTWPKPEADRAAQFALLRLVVEASHRLLRGRSGHGALQHLLKERGLSPRTIREARLGYIPPGSASVRDLVLEVGGSLETARAAGLLRLRGRAVEAAARRAGVDESARPEDVAVWLMKESPRHPEWYSDYYQQRFDGPAGGEGLARGGHWLVMPVWTRDDDGAAACYGLQLRSCHAGENIGKGGRYRNPPVTPLMPRGAPLAGLVEDARLWSDSSRPVVVCEGGYDRLALVEALGQWYGPEGRPAVIALGTTEAVWTQPEGQELTLASLPPRRVILWSDADAPGVKSRLVLSGGFAARGHEVHVVRQELVSAGKDPSDCWVSDQTAMAEAWRAGKDYSALDWGLGVDTGPGEPSLFERMRQLDIATLVTPADATLRRAQGLSRRLGVTLEAVLAWKADLSAPRPSGPAMGATT